MKSAPAWTYLGDVASPSYSISTDMRSFPVKIAVDLGVPQACIVQHLHFLIETGAVAVRDDTGRPWVHMTPKDWAAVIPFISRRTLRLAMRNVRDIGLVRHEYLNGEPTMFSLNYDIVRWALND